MSALTVLEPPKARLSVGDVSRAGQLTYGMARKYEARADQWLGLGSAIGNIDIIDTVVYSRKPWEKDALLAEITSKTLKGSGRRLNREMKAIGKK